MIRLGVVLDSALEGWTSMDYVGEMLLETLRQEHMNEVAVSPIQPWAPRLLGRLPGPGRRLRENTDRIVARCLIYPAFAGFVRKRFDVFHIVDHSYAHAAHALPHDRTGIYCHDLDALWPLLADSARFSPHKRALAWSLLRGLQQASLVFYNTEHVRAEITRHGLLDQTKLIHAPLGVAAEFRSSGPVDAPVERTLPPGRFLLHVGSGVPRKRLDLLFRAFAATRRAEPDLFLVQQGARLTADHVALLDELGIRSGVLQFPALTRTALAYLYRRAALVVLPSEREGFGLPLIEALACGTLVLATDIPAFREVGGTATSYCDGIEPSDWAAAMLSLLRGNRLPSSVKERVAHAARFSWSRHAEIILRAYRALP